MSMGFYNRLKKLPVWAKLLLGILLLFLLLLLVGTIYLNDLINRRLKQMVHEASNELYKLDYTKVRLNLFSGNLSVYDLKLTADTALYMQLAAAHVSPHYLVTGEASLLTIKNVHWLNWLISRSVAADNLVIGSPALNITQYSGRKDTIARNQSGIKQMLSQKLNSLKLGSFNITNATVKYQHIDTSKKERTIYKFESLNFLLEDLALTKNKQDSLKKISFGKYDVSIKNYKYRTSDSMYLMEMNNFEYNSRNDKAVFSSFAIHPLLSESDYSKLPFQKERNDLKFENITLQGLDILSLIDRGEIRMKQMKIGAGSWNVYLSRIPPLPPSRKEVVPAQKLMKIRVPLIIEEFQVENFQLKYKEFNTATKETGRVNFNDISGKIDHITNIISEINRNAHAKMAMRARLMNSGPFKANFDFLLNDVTGRFSVTASLGRMDATELNPGFIPLNKIEIKKGTIDEMSCSGSGNENFAKGDASLLYHDLHISIMGKDKNADTLKRKSLVSLVANIFVKNDNPKKGEPVRKAQNILIKRDPKRSYFNMLWMVLFTGIVKIATGK